MYLSICSATVAGPRNIRDNKLNQDAVIQRFWGNYWCIAVCDGMGSKPFAERGSTLACQSIYKVLKSCEDFDLCEKIIAKQIYLYWLRLLKDKNIPPSDAATTCLFAWGNKLGEVRLFQLGDGAIYYQTDHFGQVAVKNLDLFSNQTNALGYSKSWNDWSYKKVFLNQNHHGIGIMTDGVSDDLQNEQHFLSFLIKNAQLKNYRLMKKNIKNELLNWSTPQHSDDKSIGLICWKR